MAAKKQYLYRVQDESGRVVLACVVETAKPGSVEAQRLEDGTIRLLEDGKAVGFGTGIVAEKEKLTFERQPYGEVSHAKVASKRVKRAK